MLATPAPPKTPRAKRALKRAAPRLIEQPRQTLLLKGARTSEITNRLLQDLHTLKTPLSTRFTRKNPDILPFNDASSLEFFSQKNDTSLMLFASHQKKRPHALTLLRFWDGKVLDMAELLVQPDTFRSMNQFKGRKPSTGLKPLLTFTGTAWDAPEGDATSLSNLKSQLTDLFRGGDVNQVDVEGLQYVLSFSAPDTPSSASASSAGNGDADAVSTQIITLRAYLLQTKRSTSRLPKVTLEEMGPRVDFKLGRSKKPDASAWKEAMKKPRALEPKSRKNIETDLMGDKMGRIHVGKQNLTTLQTRKMKGLKRGRGEDGMGDLAEGVEGMDVDVGDEGESKRAKL